MTALLRAPTVRKLQSKIGYTFKNPQYLWEAVQAPGSVLHPDEVPSSGTDRHGAGLQKFPDGNKRLALLGDTILKLALLEDWYKGQESREKMSRIIGSIGANPSLMTVGRAKGLDALINKNPSDKDYPVGGRTIADTIEAIIGAVYVDSNSNVQIVKEVMQTLDLTPEFFRKMITEVRPSESVESPAVDK
ncbi:ribonuclease III domain-containing protein [Usnea florida]